jgi:hypothetical protein
MSQELSVERIKNRSLEKSFHVKESSFNGNGDIEE